MAVTTEENPRLRSRAGAVTEGAGAGVTWGSPAALPPVKRTSPPNVKMAILRAIPVALGFRQFFIAIKGCKFKGDAR
jgi:hypothetical protein